MAVVEFNRKTLESLIGEELTETDLEDKIPMLGCDIEGMDKQTVEYEVFPNRPDMLSEEGFARAVRYFLGLDKGLPKYNIKNTETNLNKEKVKARPCITGAIIKDVEINDEILRSLMQVQEKIHKTFGRERRKVAIGIHDLDKIKPPFTYRAVDPEKYSFKPLGWEEELTLKQIHKRHEKGEYADILEEDKRWPVIEDSEGYTLSFPPVINGKKTEVTTKTRNLFIDVTGTDQKAIDKALNIIITTLTERKGDIHPINIEGIGKRPDLTPETIKVDLEYVNRLLGLSLLEDRFQEYLEGMGYGYEDGKVLIPPYRTDIMHPIDIVEDIAIRRGYKEFNREIPQVATIGDPCERKETIEKVRQLITGLGYQEVKNTVLTNKEKQFKNMRRKEKPTVELKKPLDSENAVCKRKSLHQLLENLSNNQHRAYPQRVFEISNCLTLNKEEETGVEDHTKLAIAKVDSKVNYNEATSLLDAITKNLDRSYKLKKTEDPAFIKGRSADILNKGEKIGELGEVHPETLNNWGIEKPVIAIELNLDKLLNMG